VVTAKAVQAKGARTHEEHAQAVDGHPPVRVLQTS